MLLLSVLFLMLFLIIALVSVFYIVFYSILFTNSSDKEAKCPVSASSIDEYHYSRKNYINDFDSEFISKLHPIADELGVEVVPNVVLSEVVNRDEIGDSRELDTCVSFGFFEKDFKNVLLLINLSKNDIIRSICKKSKVGYMEVKTNSLTDLKHIKSRVSKAINK